MPITHSPLRYPGGKTAIFDIISNISEENGITPCTYAEPYAGGGGLALSMLFSGKADNIFLNDIDRSIWSFWHTIINETERFTDKVLSTDITINEWHAQRQVQNNKNLAETFDLAFSSFFLNRTNRSGIILKAGVIGGLAQEGKYKLHCRFNKEDLIKKINKIAKFKDKITLSNDDAIVFMKRIDKLKLKNMLFCIDPPYYEKGSSLYTNFYEKDDHLALRDFIVSLKSPWILTYDNADKIKELYKNELCYKLNLNYSAAQKRIGEEVFVTSSGMTVQNMLKNNRLVEL